MEHGKIKANTHTDSPRAALVDKEFIPPNIRTILGSEW